MHYSTSLVIHLACVYPSPIKLTYNNDNLTDTNQQKIDRNVNTEIFTLCCPSEQQNLEQ